MTDFQYALARESSPVKKYANLAVGEAGLLALFRYELVSLSAPVPGAVGYLLRSKLYARILRGSGRGVVLGRNISIRHPGRVTLGDGVMIDDSCSLDAKGDSEKGITLGDGVVVARNTSISCKGGYIEIGENSNISGNCMLISESSLVVGKNVLVAGMSYLIAGGNHGTERTDIPIIRQEVVQHGGIRIEDNVWIGASVVVLDGVTIGHDSIIGAGAVGDERHSTVFGGSRCACASSEIEAVKMRKVNVVHICDKFGVRGSTTHGVSKFFANIFPYFDYNTYNVKLYGVKSSDAASRSLEATGISMGYMGHDRLSPTLLQSFLSVIRREQADILHLHGWISANFGRVAGRIAHVPTVMHEHGVDPHFPVAQRIADRIISPFTHTAVAVSQSVRDFLVEKRSVSAGKIHVVYLGVPLADYKPAEAHEVSAVRKELCIPTDMRVVGTIGRLDEQKGITYFLKAAAELATKLPDVHFLVVGDGPKRGELEREAQSLGIAERITFTGHRDDIPAVQATLDVQAFPSLWEGTPITIYEAMAVGKTVVSTTVDGLGEVLADGESALLVPPANPGALARGLHTVLSNSTLAERLAQGAKAQSRKFDISITARNLESIYEEIRG